MMDHIEANELLDVYGCLLTPRQNEILQMYFQEDLSLSEIAQDLSISRSAIQDAIKKGLAAMEQYERLLHLQARNQKILVLMERYPQIARELQELLL